MGEHLLLGLIAGFIRWLNQRSLKSLKEVSVDYPALLRDPDSELKDHPVHIGGARKWGSLLVGTVLVCMIVCLLTCGILLEEMDRKPGPGGAGPAALLVLVLWVVTPLASWFAVKRYLAARAGSAFLNRDGVTLSCRNEIVFCPWELFATTGAPVRTGEDRVLVPVAAPAVAGIVIERNGNIDDSGNIRTRPLTYKTGDQIALRQLYEVDVTEMATFFLYVGRLLTPVRAVENRADHAAAWETDQASDQATQQDNGWITVYVSRLRFAPQCSACAAPTSGRQIIRASIPLMKRTTNSGELALSVPVCLTCRRRCRRRSWARLILGLMLAVLAFIVLTFLTFILTIAAPALGMVSIVPTILIPVAIGIWGVSGSRRLAAPLDARRWLPGNGTVQLRFRSREGAAILVAGQAFHAQDLMPRPFAATEN
jgi:hypothetical protein